MTQHSSTGTAELLPCPFCGGRAELRSRSAFTEHRISCASCAASSFCSGDVERVIAFWNRRSAPAQQTPGAVWRQHGERDPHGNTYDCERAQLSLGHLSDDQLANNMFLEPNIVTLTAAKERIRWLSRRLSEGASSVTSTDDKSPEPEARYIKRNREFIERGLSDASNSADPALAADARRALDAFRGAKP